MTAQTGTHIANITGRVRTESSPPTNPQVGDEYFDTTALCWYFWSGNNWMGAGTWTTTSTSTSITTSTSTTSSSTSTSTTTSTSTSTSTSTTTTI